MVVTGGILVLQLPVSAPCAYPLAHLRFSGHGSLFAAFPAPLHVAAILSVTAHRDDHF
ncbi:hypothetical protein [Salipiger mangrovisoli]|uniref:Uncharacterized protein n=1 Tax=Salipiger mangrovisoli TaxID=2865933 RepID=A0ABR9X950_9RHOB|nr:hypothetical protein [Salipiger mangrovisoli]MBE9640135.1 hypothetical protein [Salipiger mangrovisoli]